MQTMSGQKYSDPSFEVAGYFQKVGGEMEVCLLLNIFRPGVWGPLLFQEVK